jgi:hypothetical protein
MIGRRIDVSDILIGELEYTSPCDISDDSDLPDKVDPESCRTDTCLCDRRYRSPHLCVERYPAKPTIPGESLDQSRPWIVVDSCIARSDI